MRQPQNAKRGRGRGRRGNSNNHHNHVPNRNTSYESNGPDVKLRGNAQQLHEKYMALAHDAASAGERISAEAYTQFADHYFRLHQAAAGVAEAKRHQEQAAASVSVEEEPHDSGSKEIPARGIASEGSDPRPAVAREISDADDTKATGRRGRQNAKSEVTADSSDSSPKTAVDPLSSAQLSETVHDKAVAS